MRTDSEGGKAQTETTQMVADSRSALQDLRRALIELYNLVGADPEQPQDVSRRFSINRNLTWKLARVMNADDPFAALNHLPGNQGMVLALAAFEKAGAPTTAVEPVQAALRHFEETVLRHSEDRDHFELTLESMGLFHRENRPESGRELAYRGNSMIWGAQMKTRLLLSMLAPSSDRDDAVDLVQIFGLIGFRRLRPDTRWRLARTQLHDDEGHDLQGTETEEALDPSEGEPNPMLMRRFCSPNLPALEAERRAGTADYFMPSGPAGTASTYDCSFGFINRHLPRYWQDGSDRVSLSVIMSMPVETLVMDLVVHKSIALPKRPEVRVFGCTHAAPDDPSTVRDSYRLPISATVTDLPGHPPALSTPLVPRYSEMATMCYGKMGWKPSDFRGLRAQMPYPPMPSRIMLEWPMERR